MITLPLTLTMNVWNRLVRLQLRYATFIFYTLLATTFIHTSVTISIYQDVGIVTFIILALDSLFKILLRQAIKNALTPAATFIFSLLVTLHPNAVIGALYEMHVLTVGYVLLLTTLHARLSKTTRIFLYFFAPILYALSAALNKVYTHPLAEILHTGLLHIVLAAGALIVIVALYATVRLLPQKSFRNILPLFCFSFFGLATDEHWFFLPAIILNAALFDRVEYRQRSVLVMIWITQLLLYVFGYSSFIFYAHRGL